jgi:hypothetical protein
MDTFPALARLLPFPFRSLAWLAVPSPREREAATRINHLDSNLAAWVAPAHSMCTVGRALKALRSASFIGLKKNGAERREFDEAIQGRM